MTGVRWRPDTGFEGQCDECGEWWPLADTVSWVPRQGLKRCRACLAERQRIKNAKRRSDPALRAEDTEAMKAYRHANADLVNERRRAYYRKQRERINANARRRYAERGEAAKRLIYKRDWMRAHRAKLLRDAA